MITKEMNKPKAGSKVNDGQSVMSVTAIQAGTVIDHIQVGKAILLLRLLRLENYAKQVTVGLHLPSGQTDSKDIIKIEGWELTPQETSQIAIFSPKATINIIQNYRVVDKYTVALPTAVEDFIICPNPNCITNHERAKRTFYVHACRKEIQLQCKYCEKAFAQNEIVQYDL